MKSDNMLSETIDLDIHFSCLCAFELVYSMPPMTRDQGSGFKRFL